ncbi:MAG: hypothetical protein L0K82_03440 [Pisciglobus halotolerans]|nr:hypothetical protein [Pisciglobus halotolerans]
MYSLVFEMEDKKILQADVNISEDRYRSYIQKLQDNINLENAINITDVDGDVLIVNARKLINLSVCTLKESN